jgi:hypothetical protein
MQHVPLSGLCSCEAKSLLQLTAMAGDTPPLCIDEGMHDPMHKELILECSIYAVCVTLAGLLWHTPGLLSLCYLAISVGMLKKWHERSDLLFYAVAFVLGPAGEMVAIYFGAWHYAKPLYLKQLLLSPRRNGLSVKLIDGSRLMLREHASRALIEHVVPSQTPC